MPRRIRDAIGSVLVLIALVGALMLLDQRVRGRVGGVATEVASGAWNAPAAVDTIVDTGWTHYGTEAYLVAFVAAGVVLVGLMLRT